METALSKVTKEPVVIKKASLSDPSVNTGAHLHPATASRARELLAQLSPVQSYLGAMLQQPNRRPASTSA